MTQPTASLTALALFRATLATTSLTVALAFWLAACGSDPAAGPASDGDAGTADTVDRGTEDTASETGLDAGSDSAPDASDDPTVETEPDTGIGDDAAEEDPTVSPDGGTVDVSDEVIEPGGSFLTCLGHPLDHEIDGVWSHPFQSGNVSDGDPGHSVEDVIATQPWDDIRVEGKFAYGVFSTDLQDEWISAFIDTCNGWFELGRGETDGDGRVVFDIPADLIHQPGRYEVQMIVEGDGTRALGYVLAVPPATYFVVFDIDGTLTTSDTELFIDFFAELFGGDFVPEMMPDALAVTEAYSEAGYELIYLTGRPYWLDAITRAWLDDEGFPLGTLHYTRTLSESWPSQGGVGEYKRDYLLPLMADHFLFRAYGNADTDVFGYLEAGIPPEDVYIIGDNGGLDGTQAVTTYAEHLNGLEIPEADQPW